MKLKYYLRGLGIGIVVSVLVMTVAFQNRKPMTDEEIKARASELGMIENSVLTNIAGKNSEDAEDADNEDADIEDADIKDNDIEDTDIKDTDIKDTDIKDTDIKDTDIEDTDIKGTDIEDADTEDTDIQDTDTKNTDTDTKDNDAEADGKETVKDVISITVVGGDSSWTVSKKMEEAGLIESAKDFDTHLCRYGYDKKISVGTYEIPVNATHEEMAKILTKSN